MPGRRRREIDLNLIDRELRLYDTHLRKEVLNTLLIGTLLALGFALLVALPDQVRAEPAAFGFRQAWLSLRSILHTDQYAQNALGILGVGVGLVATVNIALAIPDPRAQSDDVVQGVQALRWAESLDTACLYTAAISVGLAELIVITTDLQSVGNTLLAVLLSALTVLLAATIGSRTRSPLESAMRRTVARRTDQQYLRRLASLGEKPDADRTPADDPPNWPGAGWILAVALAVAGVEVVLALVVLPARHIPDDAAALFWLAFAAAAVSVNLISLTWNRIRWAHVRGRTHRLSRIWVPWLTRAVQLGIAVFAWSTLDEGTDDQRAFGILVIAVAVAAAPSWAIVWITRPRTPGAPLDRAFPSVLTRLGRPYWSSVADDLQEGLRRHRARSQHAEDDPSGP